MQTQTQHSPHTKPHSTSLMQQAIGLATSLTSAYPGAHTHPNPRGRLRRLHDGSAQRGHERARLALAAFQHEMERGNQLPFIEPHPAESDADFQARTSLRTMNITRVVLDVLSGLYRSPVERKAPQEGVATSLRDAIERAWDEENIDMLMASADRTARLQGTCALQALWQDGALRLRLIPAQRLAVVPDPSDPTRPLAVIVLSIGSPWDAGMSWQGASFADVWTSTEYLRISGGKVVEHQQHPYGRPPFVFVRDRAAIDSFWTEGRGLSLCWDNAVLNARLSDLAQVVAMQGFGVMQITNPDPTQTITLAPGRALAFRVSGDMPYGVEFKRPGAPIAELVQEIAESIRLTLLAQRIPESAISVHVSGNASGVAIHAAGTPVYEDRLERAKLFRRVETRLYELCATVAAAHTGAQLPANLATAFRINFPEPDLAASLAERREHDEWLLSRGMTTPWALMLRDNPDGFDDLDHARRVWLEQRDEIGAFPSQHPDTQG